MFKGGDVGLAEDRLYPIPYSKGVREFIEELSKKRNFRKGLLTTSLNIVAEKAAEELGFDFCYCNTLYRENGSFTGEIDYLVPLWDKQEVLLRNFNQKDFEKTMYVGDSKNDVLCMNMVGLPIAFNPKDKETEKAAKYTVHDFRHLAKFLY